MVDSGDNLTRADRDAETRTNGGGRAKKPTDTSSPKITTADREETIP